MENSKWENFGSVFGQLIEYIYIYIGIILIAAVIALIAVISYLRKKKAGTAGSDNKKAVLHRIVIYVCLGALVLITLPFLLGFILQSGTEDLPPSFPICETDHMNAL